VKNIVLMGNPNVGKSVIFSRLTGTHVVTSNYPGTTVDYSQGTTCFQKEKAVIIDAPGTYSLTPSNLAEEVAVEVLKKADLVVNVIDATNLERNLILTLDLLSQNIPLLVALNVWDEAHHTGIDIDISCLEKLLGVPVIPTVAVTGEGISVLAEHCSGSVPVPPGRQYYEDEKWVLVGQITQEVQHITHRHHSAADLISDATIKPVTGIPVAFGIILCSLWAVIFAGETCITYITDPFFEFCLPFITHVSDVIGPGLLRQILIGELIDGQIDYEQSMGMLTTGLYVPFGIVLPYVTAFYILAAVLEDSGYLPRLATLTDTFFHRVGMHGYGIVPVFLGLGCNVPGILATRVLETRKQRFIAASLVAISVPCMAKTAMIFGTLGQFGIRYIVMVIIVLVLVYVTIGTLLNRILQGVCPEIFLEIPPYRRPRLDMILKKTWMRLVSFIAEAVPYLFLGVLLINILYATGFLAWLGTVLSPLIVGWLGLPREASAALLTGFLRKDLAIGMLLPLHMTPEQLVIAVTTLTMYFPCVGAFAVLYKELGLVDMGKAVLVMVCTAFLTGGIIRFILIGI
jgi:ferrous iron transport protein B